MNYNYISIAGDHFCDIEDKICTELDIRYSYHLIMKEWGIEEIDIMTADDEKFEYDHPDGHMCFRILDKNKFIFAAMKYNVQFSNLEVKSVV